MSAAGPSPAGESKSLATVLVPVAGVALIVVLVVVIGATNEPQATDKGGGPAAASSIVKGPGKAMSDGSDGGTEDPDLKPIGDGGLKYRDLKVGNGPDCPPGASVKAHYAGWLPNGTEFDASRKHGSDPIEFSLKGVVAGWTEGIPNMRVGGIRKLVIPAAMGYGARGQGKIPGGATLIFEVELVAIN